jgi:hypothetical protein
MNQEEFDTNLGIRLEKIRTVLGVKAKEYVRNGNPLHNFEVGAGITGETSAKVLDGFLLKHIISYRDILNDLDEGKLPTKERVDEKIGYIINYFIIQEALLYDMIGEKKELIKDDRQIKVKTQYLVDKREVVTVTESKKPNYWYHDFSLDNNNVYCLTANGFQTINTTRDQLLIDGHTW